MSTTDNKENNKEIKTEALPAKKVSASETHQLHVVIHPDINGFGRLFGGRLLEWIDEVARRHRQTSPRQRRHHRSHLTTCISNPVPI